MVSDAAAAIEFYKKASGAEEILRVPAEDGKRLLHAQLRIGTSMLYLCDDFPEFCGGTPRTPGALGGTPVTIHQHVSDCDAAIDRAAAAGATVTMPAMDAFWGDRYGQVQDPFGQQWSFSTPLKKG